MRPGDLTFDGKLVVYRFVMVLHRGFSLASAGDFEGSPGGAYQVRRVTSPVKHQGGDGEGVRGGEKARPGSYNVLL